MDTQPEKQPAWWKNTRGEWYVVVQTVLFALVALGPAALGLRVELPDALRVVALVAGLALGATGLALALAGIFWLGDNLSVFPHPKDDAQLVQTGAYRIVRHPIYSGLIIGAVGWALLNASVLTLVYAGLLFVFFDVKSRREERWLVRKFPDYAAYQQRVHKLIPFVY
ncbi:MAG: isoprenylcysteine carboxylmethyltransferase family protein [Chloroflexi bacterium]|nr:isoprenylcysteine carboxylmethyltransferase family protein [Chloroflexota bacterium]